MTNKEANGLMLEVFDATLHDTRYKDGTIALYSAMLAKKYNQKADTYEAAAKIFVDDTEQWHEERRYNFEPHPEFEEKILEHLKNKKYPLVESGLSRLNQEWPSIPEIEHLINSIKMYVTEGRQTGDFLGAVLRNDLANAIGYADDTSMKYLKNIVQTIYCDAPSNCWGNKEKVEAWLKQWQEYRNETK